MAILIAVLHWDWVPLPEAETHTQPWDRGLAPIPTLRALTGQELAGLSESQRFYFEREGYGETNDYKSFGGSGPWRSSEGPFILFL